MAKKKKTKEIKHYEHPEEQRPNIPHVGLVTPTTDPDTGAKKKYQYDPHLDPQLQWAGKTEHSSFEIPTVSLHVHERIDPKTIIETVKKEQDSDRQFSLFEQKKPLREAIDFYKHKEGWSNRLIAGDSLLVMNSLLEKEGMAGKVQMIYIDPPYGIKYGSNFMPFVNKRDVKDGNDDDLSAEPEMIKAFRDTWELGIHSYLSYLRDRLLLSRELLNDSGSVFVQISDENVHHVREIMDEIFGAENFVSMITMKRASVMFTKKYLKSDVFYLLFYGKNIENIKYNQLYLNQDIKSFVESSSSHLWFEDTEAKNVKKSTPDERKNIVQYLQENSKVKLFSTLGLNAQGTAKQDAFNFNGINYFPPAGTQWKTSYAGLKALAEKDRIIIEGNKVRYKYYYADYPVSEIGNYWEGIGAAGNKIYIVQTNDQIVQNAILMSTDPGDLVLDITCGSGTTATVAEQWGRRWITCDTSRVALTLAKQRLMTAQFDYYQLAHPQEGVGSGFVYKTVPHVTLKSIANNEPPATETLYDQPLKENNKARVTGPFTVEAVPAPYAKSLDALENEGVHKDTASGMEIARSGETFRQDEWRNELLKTGVRAKGGKTIEFVRVEPLGGTRYIQAEAETKEDIPKKVLVVFGPEHAPLEQRMVENAWQEARILKPDILLFCAFQFDEEAAKDIDELSPEKAEMQLLKAQMNADLLTDDLRKKRSSNESFWLIGQPDIKIKKQKDGKIIVEVMGFDYYNPKTGNVDSGGKKDIAMWMLDTDYDNRSLFPSQVFFPMAGEKDGWGKLAKNLKAEIDLEKIESYKGTVSLPFESGAVIAVKIIDNRGIESLRVIEVETL